jgi:deglycase
MAPELNSKRIAFLNNKRIAFLFTEGGGAGGADRTARRGPPGGRGRRPHVARDRRGPDVQLPRSKGDTIEANLAVSDASASDYDGLGLPGGVANPDQLRGDHDAVRFVREFFAGSGRQRTC